MTANQTKLEQLRDILQCYRNVEDAKMGEAAKAKAIHILDAYMEAL